MLCLFTHNPSHRHPIQEFKRSLSNLLTCQISNRHPLNYSQYPAGESHKLIEGKYKVFSTRPQIYQHTNQIEMRDAGQFKLFKDEQEKIKDT